MDMYGENVIGKKVNLLQGYGFCSKKMTDEVCEIVSVVPWSKELNDWCQHYIVRKPDGTEVEIREVDCVFSPNKEKATDYMIHDFLNDNGVWADVYQYNQSNAAYVVSIEWGDWKHSHLWARDLMSYLGYVEVGSKVTEEDGSDCYSAEHYFIATA
jgi:disulfide oxidoreductase YuzD